MKHYSVTRAVGYVAEKTERSTRRGADGKSIGNPETHGSVTWTDKIHLTLRPEEAAGILVGAAGAQPIQSSHNRSKGKQMVERTDGHTKQDR